MTTQKQRIEELERRVRELEARPLVHYVPVYTPIPAQPYPNPWPVSPTPWSPWVTCETAAYYDPAALTACARVDVSAIKTISLT